MSGPLLRRAQRSPIVVVTGPRQSGKSTLVKATFPNHPYANLEAPDVRGRAIDDPRGFLAAYANGAIIDEVQRAPQLLSYIQVDVDETKTPGRWILTGSQNLLLLSTVSQSLAGRSALLELLPLSCSELHLAGIKGDLFTTLWRGGYPPLFDRNEEPQEWLADYVATYIERDVRQVLNVGDLLAFQTFLRLCASRTGQILNLSQLGSDAGIALNTAKAWLSVLEASYIVARLPPLFRNIGKRLIKSPKLHFLDSGLACYLLGIRTAQELCNHPLRGAIFESWIYAEIVKAHRNQGIVPRLSFYRDGAGHEVDLIVEQGPKLVAIEAKSGATVSNDAFYGLNRLADLLPEVGKRFVVHGGNTTFSASGGTATSFADLHQVDWVGLSL
jgi:uncharacterized protein